LHQSEFFHPDLINATDAVIGKVGYSTIAEIYQAGVAFGYIARPQFRESQFLVNYVAQEMTSLPITTAEFEQGQWLAMLPDLFALPRKNRPAQNGATLAAKFVLDVI
jgi:UDP-N-acetylglucosamine:LPS N-acetylglucosamine transferase